MYDTFVKSRKNESVKAWHRRCEKKALSAAMKIGVHTARAGDTSPEGEIFIDGEEYPIAALPYIDFIFKTPAKDTPESTGVVYAVYGGEKRVYVTTVDFRSYRCSWLDPESGILTAFITERIEYRKNRSFTKAKKVYEQSVEALEGVDTNDKSEVTKALRPIYMESRDGGI